MSLTQHEAPKGVAIRNHAKSPADLPDGLFGTDTIV
jgi:hypothetical protein